jgi:hypothetical protein
MNDFARMMEMDGVRPMGAKPLQGQRRRTHASAPQLQEQPVAVPLPASGDHAAWATGQLARKGLETALARLADEAVAGRRGWATGIRQDGSSMVLAANASVASLLSIADRQNLRLVLLGGEGWTFVLHPMMGVATLDRDPAEDAA